MPTAICDGISTHYEVSGSGPPLLLFSPGGFNATIENWTSFGIYRRLNLLEHLQRQYTCIAFDKRESGQSGGRVECVLWEDYARQGAELLDHLGIDSAYLMGGCIGCSIALEFAAANPSRAIRIVLYSPAGGPRYRIKQLRRFHEHVNYVSEYGLGGVVDLARGGDDTFAQDPRVGPWAPPIRTDAEFAAAYANWDVGQYRRLVESMAELNFDRETVPGPEALELMELDVPALVVPGRDENHATSAARYLEECLPRSEYWDVPPEEQTQESAPRRVLEFLAPS